MRMTVCDTARQIHEEAQQVFLEQGWNISSATVAVELLVWSAGDFLHGQAQSFLGLVDCLATNVAEGSFVAWVKRPTQMLAGETPLDRISEGDFAAIHDYFGELHAEP